MFFVLMVLMLMVTMAVSAQTTGGSTQPTPEATQEGLPASMAIPGEDDGSCRHINAEDVEKRGFVSTWGGGDGAYSHIRLTFTALTQPVPHDFIVMQKDEHDSNLTGSAIIVFAGDLVELGADGGHVFAYIHCRPDQMLEALLDWFGPFELEHITRVIEELGLDPEDYIHREGVLVVNNAMIATPAASSDTNTEAERNEALLVLQHLTLGDAE